MNRNSMTIGLHISLMAFTLATFPIVIVSGITFLSCALQNVMVCRAHRLLRLGKISNSPIFLSSNLLSGEHMPHRYYPDIRSCTVVISETVGEE